MKVPGRSPRADGVVGHRVRGSQGPLVTDLAKTCPEPVNDVPAVARCGLGERDGAALAVTRAG